MQALALAALLAAATPACPQSEAAGTGRLTFWGLAVYDARLWVAPGFRQSEYDRHALALELTYLRSFKGADIARRSIEEMQRAGPLAAEQAQRWEAQLARLLPDVRAGDRLRGVHRPGQGAQFSYNGKPLGEIADPAFSARFFAIWLGPSTSEPALRQALLAGTAP